MLILDISEELLYDILKRHHTCRTTKLVDDDCDTLLFLHQEPHQRTGLHALGDEEG